LNTKNTLAGKFVVLDGPDGCGKSTQSRLLAKWIHQQLIETASFRDPGTTVIGEKIRAILLDTAHSEMNTTTELLLYMAARAQLWAECIEPAINENKCVILDRWLSSTCAYQGFAGGFGVEKIIKIAEDSLPRPWPELTIILDIDLDSAANRLNDKLDRMEQKGRKYHQKVRQGFLALADQRSDFAIIDASKDIDTVSKQVIETVKEKLLVR